MKDITLGQILSFLLFIGSFIGAIKVIKDSLSKTVEKMFGPINNKIDSLELNYIKTDLVNFMSQLEIGQVSEEQKINAYELYDRYCELGGNSYVHDKWENLKKEGKL